MKQKCRGYFNRNTPKIQELGICVQSGKKCLKYTDANLIAARHRRIQDTNHHPYRCSSCGDFHVGSSIKLPRPRKSVRHHRISLKNGRGLAHG